MFALFLLRDGRHNRWPSGDRACRPLLCYLFYRIRKVITLDNLPRFSSYLKSFALSWLSKFLSFKTEWCKTMVTRWKKDLISHRFLDSAKLKKKLAEHCIACLVFLSTFSPLFSLFFYSKALRGPEAWVLGDWLYLLSALSFFFFTKCSSIISLQAFTCWDGLPWDLFYTRKQS